MTMSVDSQSSTPTVGPLVKKEEDNNTFYLDEACTEEAKLVEAGDCPIITKEGVMENGHISRPDNEGFTKDQTLFLIDLMRQHLDSEGRGLPKTMAEMNYRLKRIKAQKKLLWIEAAEKLGDEFSQKFCPEKVARKWNTLQEAYKKVKDKYRRTGKGAVRFQFYTEMDELLGGQHGDVFSVVGTSAGLEVRRPDALGHCRSFLESAASSSSHPAAPHRAPPSTLTPPPRKRRWVEEDLMGFLVRSEEAAQRRHEETLAQMKSAQRGFEALMNRLLDKMP